MSEWSDFDFVARPKPRPSVMAANGFYLLAGAGNILTGAAMALLLSWVPALRYDTVVMNGGAAYELLLLLLPVLLYWRARPEIGGALRMNRPRGKHLAIAAGAAFVGLFLSSYLGTLWDIFLQALGLRLISSPLTVGSGSMGLLAAMLSYAVLPAVCEEMVFRGAMLGAYERNGTTRAVVITSVLFALLHASVEGFPIQLMLGLVMAYFAVNADSVFVAMTYHFVHNAGVVLLTAAMPVREAVDADASIYFSIGGMAGVLQALVILVVLAVVYAVLLLMMSSDREVAGLPFGEPKPQKTRGTWQEQLVLLSGCVTVGLLMLDSLLRALRVIE